MSRPGGVMKRDRPQKESAPILKFDDGNGKGTTVVQSWITELSWKEQTVLLTGLRGPDGLASEGIRDVVRWIRSRVLYNADLSTGYMRDTVRPDWKPGADLGPTHFVEHLLIALKVIERRSPDLDDRLLAERFRASIKVLFKEQLVGV